MKKADILSCRPDHDIGKEDNEDRILLKEKRFRILVMDKGELWKELEDAKKIYRGRDRSSTERRKKKIEKRKKGDLVEGESICTRFGYTLQRSPKSTP